MEENKNIDQEIGEDEELTSEEDTPILEKDKSKEIRLKIIIAIICVVLLGGICIFATQKSKEPQTVKQDKVENKVASKTTKKTTKKSNDDNNKDKEEAEQKSTDDSNKHEHEWVQQYKTVHHDAQTHDETEKVKDAYDEPVYTQVQHLICDECGADITSTTKAHLTKHIVNGEKGTYHTVYKSEQTDTLHHDPEYQTKTVTDKDAYDEQVANGWKCSICGATKQ